MVVFNFDDVEMVCCLNQEVVKVVFFGDVFEEEVFKFVILNFVKFLYIDDWVGSFKVGKDVDIVLWIDYLFLVYVCVKYMYIDGIKFYDMDVDVKFCEEVQVECNVLIQVMFEVKDGGVRI